MLIRRHSKGYNFMGDTESGLTFHWGRTLAENPDHAPWPELADISISNRCAKGCPYCYRDSGPQGGLMSLEQYQWLLEALHSPRWGNVFQVALGGGEPLEHPRFLDILDTTAARGIVANFTTNGSLLDDPLIRRLRGKIGALAISVGHFADVDESQLIALRGQGIKANLHFILNDESLEEARAALEGRVNGKLRDCNSIIFLTHKPAGRGAGIPALSLGPALLAFLAGVDQSRCSVGIGFDACFVPLLLRHTRVQRQLVDSCECGFFSVYVDERLRVKPCSFAPHDGDTFSLEKVPFENIWNREYGAYRDQINQRQCASDCDHHQDCRGGCTYFPSITPCCRY
jgi:radical SAM protein with 4Fe4S-binding SPASM domain